MTEGSGYAIVAPSRPRVKKNQRVHCALHFETLKVASGPGGPRCYFTTDS